ncbi:ABC-2 transporter permease [Acetobacterium woodii]|uniref:ABC transport system permease protein n=1 Tax=Acetobacterium woodii (strain ATCC 29683 / DSM 1030 / JCM 2381 / KCTC 1655 / WB1) TaxID=931626 RepID=H6LCL9_ACEWD|nr:ABC-2 transporter permease [Acetobacterium woodii]AFA47801.1 ABC transport system permease protein [Acetobacterium woodii DSM 1030]
MKGLILKDILNLKGSFKTLGIMLIFFSVVFISQGNGFVFGIVIFMFAMMVITTMSYDDLAKWDIYALTMPITRKEMVLSKYLVMGILNSIGIVIALIVGVLGNLELGEPIGGELLVIVGAISLIAVIISSVVIPLIYKFGAEKARLMLILCALAPTAILLLIEQMGIPLPSIDNTWIYGVLLIAFTVVVLVISINASIKIYQKKEF